MLRANEQDRPDVARRRTNFRLAVRYGHTPGNLQFRELERGCPVRLRGRGLPLDSPGGRVKVAAAAEDEWRLVGDASNTTSRGHAGLWWLAAGAAAFVLYRVTLAPGVLWGDSGEAQLRVLMGGWTVGGQIVRSHVLYFAAARALRWLFTPDAALAANLTSALAGAVTVANAAWLLRTLCARRTAALVGVTCLALSHTFWQLSTSAEVVTTTTALLTAEWIGAVRLAQTGKRRWIAWIGLCNGLGLSNHNFAMLMWPVYALIAVRFHGSWSPRWKTVLAALPAFLLGAAPVLALCVSHWLESGSARETFRSFLTGQYAGRIAPLGEMPKLILRAGAVTVLNFPTPLLLMCVPGVINIARGALRTPREISASVRDPRMSTRHPAVDPLILSAGLIYLAFGATYGVADQHTFLVPGFVVVSIVLALGVENILSRRNETAFQWALVLLALLSPAVYAVAPSIARRVDIAARVLSQRDVSFRDPFAWFLQPWRCGYDGAERFAVAALSDLPEGAWLAADSTLAPPINYVQAARSFRRDVRLLSTVDRQPWLEAVDESSRIDELIDGGLFFSATSEPRYLPRRIRGDAFRLEPFGAVFRVSRAP